EADVAVERLGAAGEIAGPGHDGRSAAPRAERRLRLAELLLERLDPVRPRLDPLAADLIDDRGERVRSYAEVGVGAGPSQRLDPAHPRADAPLAGDQEASDLAGRTAMRPAAQLVAVPVDPDGADRL